jgi:hypothetical protein
MTVSFSDPHVFGKNMNQLKLFNNSNLYRMVPDSEKNNYF